MALAHATGTASATLAGFDWLDPFHLAEQLSEEERMIQQAAHDYAQSRLLPRVLDAFRHEPFDRAIMTEMGELGFLGPTIPEAYGGAGVNYVAYGLIAREVERVDSGYRSAMSVQSSLGHAPDPRLRQRGAAQEVPAEAGHRRVDRLLRPHRARFRLRPRRHATRAKKVDGGCLLSGAKIWITNSPIADVFVVWAKDDDGVIRGFILEQGWKGLSRPKIEGKFSLRASITGEIVMDEVFVPEDNLLPNVKGLKGRSAASTRARYGIAWGTMGAAEFCWHARATTRWSASSSAGRSPPTSWSRRSSPTCRPRSRSGCRPPARRPPDGRGPRGARR